MVRVFAKYRLTYMVLVESDELRLRVHDSLCHVSTLRVVYATQQRSCSIAGLHSG